MLQTANNNNNNNEDNDFDNNKGYIEKILNKDKEKLKRYGNNIYTLKHDKHYNMNDDSDFNGNDLNNNIDVNRMILNEKRRRRRDGKGYCIIQEWIN